MNELLPLLIVALIVWAGVFGFMLVVDGRVRRLEKLVAARRLPVGESGTVATRAAEQELGR